MIFLSRKRPKDLANGLERKAFPFQEACEPPPLNLRFETGETLQLLYCFPKSDIVFGSVFEDLAKGLADKIGVKPLASQFLLDPAFSEPAQPDPALSPLDGKRLVVYVSQPDQVGKNMPDHTFVEALVPKLRLYFGGAARTNGKDPVNGVFSAPQFFVF